MTLCIQIRIPIAGWVAPFGYPWINACSRLPMAFRSVPRPSSPPGAKASTERPSHAHVSRCKLRSPDPILHRNHPTTRSRRTSDLSPSRCRLPHTVARTTSKSDGRAITAQSILTYASEHFRLRGFSTLDLLRSDLQPARPDAPNPNSHFKRPFRPLSSRRTNGSHRKSRHSASRHRS